MTEQKEESNTKREMRLLRSIESFVDYSQFEIGHPIRALRVELLELRQKKTRNRLEASNGYRATSL